MKNDDGINDETMSLLKALYQCNQKYEAMLMRCQITIFGYRFILTLPLVYGETEDDYLQSFESFIKEHGITLSRENFDNVMKDLNNFRKKIPSFDPDNKVHWQGFLNDLKEYSRAEALLSLSKMNAAQVNFCSEPKRREVLWSSSMLRTNANAKPTGRPGETTVNSPDTSTRRYSCSF